MHTKGCIPLESPHIGFSPLPQKLDQFGFHNLSWPSKFFQKTSFFKKKKNVTPLNKVRAHGHEILGRAFVRATAEQWLQWQMIGQEWLHCKDPASCLDVLGWRKNGDMSQMLWSPVTCINTSGTKCVHSLKVNWLASSFLTQPNSSLVKHCQSQRVSRHMAKPLKLCESAIFHALLLVLCNILRAQKICMHSYAQAQTRASHILSNTISAHPIPLASHRQCHKILIEAGRPFSRWSPWRRDQPPFHCRMAAIQPQNTRNKKMGGKGIMSGIISQRNVWVVNWIHLK
jgi:hypothetical protein